MVPATMALMDVIFILLAVFLSVSQIRKSTVKVDLPEVSDAVATGERDPAFEPLRVVIHLTSDGRIGFEGEVFHTREMFFERFRVEMAKKKREDRGVVAEIVSDRRAESGEMVDLINFLTKQGIKRLEFLAVERGK
jgi:biopolymer transport protein ExbD